MSDDIVVQRIIDAIATYQSSIAPSLSDLNTLIESISSAISSGEIDASNLNDVIIPLLELFYEDGLSNLDYYYFFQNLANNVDEESTETDLSSLFFSYILDLLSGGSSESTVMTATELPLMLEISQMLIPVIYEAYLDVSDDSFGTFMGSFPTPDSNRVLYNIGYMQTDITDWLATKVANLESEGVDTSLISKFEEKVLYALSLFQNINYSNFKTSIYNWYHAEWIYNQFAAVYWSTYSQRGYTSLYTQMENQRLDSGNITGAGFLKAVENFVATLSTDSKVDFTIGFFSRALAHFNAPDSTSDEYNASVGFTLDLALPSSTCFTTEATDNFGVWSVTVDYDTAQTILTDIQDIYNAHEADQGFPTTISLLPNFEYYYNTTLGAPYAMTYDQFLEYREIIVTSLKSAGYPQTEIDYLYDLYEERLSSGYTSFKNEFFTYTISGDNLATHFETVEGLLQDHLRDLDDYDFIYLSWQALRNIPNLSANGLSGFGYLQIGCELLNFVSLFADQDTLDDLGSDLMAQAFYFSANGVEETESDAEEVSYIQNDQLSTAAQLGIALGVAGIIMLVGLVYTIVVAAVAAGAGAAAAATAGATAEAAEAGGASAIEGASATFSEGGQVIVEASDSAGITASQGAQATVQASEQLTAAGEEGLSEAFADGSSSSSTAQQIIKNMADELSVSDEQVEQYYQQMINGQQAMKLSEEALVGNAQDMVDLFGDGADELTDVEDLSDFEEDSFDDEDSIDDMDEDEQQMQDVMDSLQQEDVDSTVEDDGFDAEDEFELEDEDDEDESDEDENDEDEDEEEQEDQNSMVTVDEGEIEPGSVEGLNMVDYSSIQTSMDSLSTTMSELNTILEESGAEAASSSVYAVSSSVNDAVSELQFAIQSLDSTQVTQETVDYLTTQVDLVTQTQSELTSLITGNSIEVSADGLNAISANESALSTLSESVEGLTPYIEDPVSTAEIVGGTTLGVGGTTFGAVEGAETDENSDKSDEESDDEELNS